MIEGTLPALLTPFTAAGEVDLHALDLHLDWLHERGVRTVSPLGTTGEGPSLSLEERKAVIERVARHRSGMAFVPGTGCTALPDTVELSAFALDQGAQAVLVAPPTFFPPSEDGVLRYYAALLAALPDSAAVLLYHIPQNTRIPITDRMLRELPVAGVKDSSSDREHLLPWVREFGERLDIVDGSDDLVAAHHAAGGRATITLLANVVPEELDGIRAGDDAERRQRRLSALREAVSAVPRHAAVKYVLHLLTGLPASGVRPPLDDLTAAQRVEVQQRLSELEE